MNSASASLHTSQGASSSEMNVSPSYRKITESNSEENIAKVKGALQAFPRRIEATLQAMNDVPFIVDRSTQKRIKFLLTEIHKILGPESVIVSFEETLDSSSFTNAFHDFFSSAIEGSSDVMPVNIDIFFTANIRYYGNSKLLTICGLREGFGDRFTFDMAIHKVQDIVNQLALIAKNGALIEDNERLSSQHKSSEEENEILVQKNLDLIEAFAQKEKDALQDDLTQIANRKALNKQIDNKQIVSSVVMCDADHFKKINDTYGHGIGDIVLIDIATIIANTAEEFFHLNKDDRILGIPGHFLGISVYRIGGEEFALVVNNCDTRTISDFAELLKQRINEREYTVPVAQIDPDHSAIGTIPVTISMGIAINSGEKTFGEMLEIADGAMYLAKHNGRNRIEISEILIPIPSSKEVESLHASRERRDHINSNETPKIERRKKQKVKRKFR